MEDFVSCCAYTVSVAVEDVGSASVVMTVDGFTGDSYNEVKETSLLRSPNDNAAPNSSLTLDEPEPRRLFCIKNWSPAAFKPFAVPYKILTAPTLPHADVPRTRQ